MEQGSLPLNSTIASSSLDRLPASIVAPSMTQIDGVEEELIDTIMDSGEVEGIEGIEMGGETPAADAALSSSVVPCSTIEYDASSPLSNAVIQDISTAKQERKDVPGNEAIMNPEVLSNASLLCTHGLVDPAQCDSLKRISLVRSF
jgi:hypothetical protein